MVRVNPPRGAGVTVQRVGRGRVESGAVYVNVSTGEIETQRSATARPVLAYHPSKSPGDMTVQELTDEANNARRQAAIVRVRVFIDKELPRAEADLLQATLSRALELKAASDPAGIDDVVASCRAWELYVRRAWATMITVNENLALRTTLADAYGKAPLPQLGPVRDLKPSSSVYDTYLALVALDV